MRFNGNALGALLFLTLYTSAAQAETLQRKFMTLDSARKVVTAAVLEAHAKNAPGAAIAVVDDGGNLVSVERLDNTFPAGARISIGKARTAALFRKPTKVFEDIVNKGRTTMVALEDFTPLQGGVPILVDDQIIGAIGVSGAASAQQDEEIALAGARALASSRTGSPVAETLSQVTYINRDKATTAFGKGSPLLEVPGYKVHASRRDGPGLAEVHRWETDVIYVLEGSATFVTGGSLVDGKTTEPGQIRGPTIRGGQTYNLVKGDVMIVPNGVPHWFKEVKAPFLYFVVKPIATGDGYK